MESYSTIELTLAFQSLEGRVSVFGLANGTCAWGFKDMVGVFLMFNGASSHLGDFLSSGRGFGKGAQRSKFYEKIYHFSRGLSNGWILCPIKGQLIGIKEMILVYVYMPRGTLYNHLHKVTDTPLSWIQRLKIAIGAGRGLDYLHTGFGTQNGVIHRDVKSSNILLDENLAAMISDFGLSKIGPIDQTAYNVSVSVKGTFGYLDPEYFYTSKLTRKTDVYAFGKSIASNVYRDLLELQEKCDNSADSPGTSGFTWMIRKYRTSATNQNSGQGGTGFPKSNEKHMNQGSLVNRDGGDIGKKPHEHGELVAGDIKIFTYDALKTAIRNFKNHALFGLVGYEKWWIHNTGYSPSMDDTGLPILVKILDSHILSDLKMLKEFRHPNLVKVIGYYKGETNLLVSEFVHNRNFEDLLHSGLLPLAAKVKVAVGIARGIVYLCNTTNNVGKVSYFSRYSELWDWDKTICTFELNKYKILLDEDFTAKLLEYDITKLVEDYDYDYDKRFMQYHITGLVDGDYVPGLSSLEVDIPLQTKIFSGFRSVFTEVLTGRNFSLEEFHKINHLLRKHGKESLGLVAKLCYENCNTIDIEQMMLKYFEEYENYIHMGSRHL
ncbi:serine/threonine/dual specificity protein kinase, catalytic domain-containing protein [Tanacetum coccineum]|uniref:Serine/threonine/dual specificity protein kinase, catalytic domain-containing protein n=1 Tax=Tanacetum coccineum TaxID=301880 RepID=A0ABQ4WP68_9ASTR